MLCRNRIVLLIYMRTGVLSVKHWMYPGKRFTRLTSADLICI